MFKEDDKVLTSINILIAEDAQDIRLLMTRILTRRGAKIIAAENGADALEKIGSAAFDIVLMDLQMPVMDGHEAAPLLRASGYKGPIIALTGHSVEYAKDHESAFDFDGYLQKPVSTQNLIQKILEHCSAKGHEPDHGRESE